MLKEVYSAGIIGVGAYIPDNIRKNDFWDDKEIANLPKKDKDPFKGIEERRVFDDKMLPSDVETLAGKSAIEDASLSVDDIDLVLVHSMLQDEIVPSNASLVQHKLGLKNASAWGMDTCCSSFITMVASASNLIAMGEFKNILIISSVIHSKMVDYSDYLSTNTGDAVAAIIMGRVPDNRGYISYSATSDGYFHDAFTMKERLPYNVKESEKCDTDVARPYFTINPKKAINVGRNSTSEMKEVLDAVLEKAKFTEKDIKLFLSHQPCHWAHGAWRDSIGIDAKNSYETYHKYGNVASATIPLNLYESKKLGLLKDGDNLLFASPGAGKNHAALILKWYEN